MGDINDAYITRTLRALGAGIGDVDRLFVSVSHQITTHRRASTLWDAKSKCISAKDILAMRQAPFMGADHIIDPDHISRICEKKQDDAQRQRQFW